MSICKLNCELKKAGDGVKVYFEITESSETDIYRHPLGVLCMGLKMRLSKLQALPAL